MARPKREAPWLEQRGSVFYITHYDPGARQTRRISTKTSDAAEARVKLARFLETGGFEPRADARLSVSAGIDAYLREWADRNCADSTRQHQAAAHLKAHFGETPLEEVTISDSETYADHRRRGIVGVASRRLRGGRCVTDSTIRRELVVLSAAARHAFRRQRIGRLPAIERPKERVLSHDEEAPFFSRDEIARMIFEATGELRWFIVLAYYTAARRGSIENLEWRQVKRDRGVILLQKPEKKATKKRQPIVPIFRAVETALRAQEAADDKRIFVGRRFYGSFRRLCKRLGIDEARSHPHILRHSRATHLLLDGKSIYDVAKLLGDTPATVARVYGHHSAEHLAFNLEG